MANYLSKHLEGTTSEIQQTLQAKVDASYNGLGAFIEKDVANGKITTSV